MRSKCGIDSRRRSRILQCHYLYDCLSWDTSDAKVCGPHDVKRVHLYSLFLRRYSKCTLLVTSTYYIWPETSRRFENMLSIRLWQIGKLPFLLYFSGETNDCKIHWILFLFVCSFCYSRPVVCGVISIFCRYFVYSYLWAATIRAGVIPNSKEYFGRRKQHRQLCTWNKWRIWIQRQLYFAYSFRATWNWLVK